MNRKVKSLVRKWLGTWLGRALQLGIFSDQQEEYRTKLPLPTMLPPPCQPHTASPIKPRQAASIHDIPYPSFSPSG